MNDIGNVIRILDWYRLVASQTGHAVLKAEELETVITFVMKLIDENTMLVNTFDIIRKECEDTIAKKNEIISQLKECLQEYGKE